MLLILNSPTQTLQLVLAESEFYNSGALAWTVEWQDTDSAGNVVSRGADKGFSNGSTPVNIMSGPASGQRELWHFSYCNNDNDGNLNGNFADHRAILQRYDGTNTWEICQRFLSSRYGTPLGTLFYSKVKGFYNMGER